MKKFSKISKTRSFIEKVYSSKEGKSLVLWTARKPEAMNISEKSKYSDLQ